MFNRFHKRIQNLSNAEVLGILIVVALASAISSALNGTSLDSNWWANVSEGLVTEMAGAAATFWLINLIFEGRRKREEEERGFQRESEKENQAIQAEKDRLIRQLSSKVNPEAVRAAEELWQRGWSLDGSLRGAILNDANLQGANFWSADLQGIWGWYANLQDTDLYNAKLRESHFQEANFQNSRLIYADLQYANLARVQLQKADLEQANLQGARLDYVEIDESTILPDGTHWSLSEGILQRFTDPNHPQFWRSDNHASPAYQGNGGKGVGG